MMFNHHVLENSGPMLWLDRDTGTVTYANPAACKQLGYPVEELLGMGIPQFDVHFDVSSLPILHQALRETRRAGRRCRRGTSARTARSWTST